MSSGASNGRTIKAAQPDSKGLAPALRPAPGSHYSIGQWITLCCHLAAIAAAPVVAGGFSTPPHFSFLPYDTVWSALLDLGTPIILALSAIAFLANCWSEWKHPVALGRVPALAGSAAVLTLFAVISAFRARPIYLGLNALAVFLATLVASGTLSRVARDRWVAWAGLCAIAAGAAIVSAFGVHEYLGYWKQGVVDHRTFGTYLNPDFLAGYLGMAVPISLALFTAARERLVSIALGTCVALQGAAALLTGSRAGVLTLLMGVGIWAALCAVSRSAAGNWRRTLIGLAILLVGAAAASAPTRVRVMGAPSGAPAAHAPGRNAVAGIEAAAAAEGYSADFRRYTWLGASKMAIANPLFGTGLGAFAIDYPRYAETAFTAHAHNGFLQWTAEAGVPAAPALLAVVAAACAIAAAVLLVSSKRAPVAEAPAGRSASKQMPEAAGTGRAELFDMDGSSRLVLCALLAAVAASMAHNLIDSDWYVVGTAMTLATVLALCISFSRQAAPWMQPALKPLSPAIGAAGAIACGFILYRAIATAGAELAMSGAAELATVERNPEEAADRYSGAISWDPLNPEPYLDLASVDYGLGRKARAGIALERAVRVAPSGRTFYRLGRYDVDTGSIAKALDAFRRARELEPHNLQNLRALGDTYRQAGNSTAAAEAYRAITALENTPYGLVRAVPEKVETDFAYGHEGLADLAASAGDWRNAAEEYSAAVKVMREYWPTRNLLINQEVSGVKKSALADLYDQAITNYLNCLNNLGEGTSPNAASMKALQTTVRQQRAQDSVAGST